MRPARPSFILARVASLALAAGLLAAPQAARAGEDAEPLRLRGSTHDEALPTTHAPPSRPTAAPRRARRHEGSWSTTRSTAACSW